MIIFPPPPPIHHIFPPPPVPSPPSPILHPPHVFPSPACIAMMPKLFFQHYRLGLVINKQNKVAPHPDATLDKMHSVLRSDPRYEFKNSGSLRQWINRQFDVGKGEPVEGQVRECFTSGAWKFQGIVPVATTLAASSAAPPAAPPPSTRALFDRCFRLDPNEKVKLEDMHTTLKEAGEKSLTLYGGDPSRNLSNWIESEFNEEMANGQVWIKKSGTCRRVFGFAFF